MVLGITSIQRNRAQWLQEWVAFHYLVGFRKFYIYLHLCSDNSKEVLEKLSTNFDIRIIDVDPHLESPQLKCYQSAYEDYGNEVEWMAFIDGDEFLFSPSDQSIAKTLEKYLKNKNLSAIGVYWACFGSGGHIKEPHGLIIENYKRRAADGYENNRHIKSIVKTRQSPVFLKGPHLFSTPLGTFDENLRLIEKGWTDYEPTYKNFRINHYVTQSREFFLNFKSKVIPPDGALKRDESFWVEHNRNDILDTSMDRFIGPLKEILETL
jgi:hypothetical protein